MKNVEKNPYFNLANMLDKVLLELLKRELDKGEKSNIDFNKFKIHLSK